MFEHYQKTFECILKTLNPLTVTPMTCIVKLENKAFHLYRSYVCGNNISARLAKAKYKTTLLQIFQAKITFNFASIPTGKTVCIAQNFSDENEINNSVQNL